MRNINSTLQVVEWDIRAAADRNKPTKKSTLPSKHLSFLLRRSLLLFPGILQLQISIDFLAYISDLYDSLFASLVAGSTPLIQCILTNGSRNSGVNLSPNLNG